jgi:hypothetical protein
MRYTLKEVLTLLLSHTAADTNDKVRVMAFEPFELAQLAVDFLLGLIANATGVQQYEVSTARLARDLIAETYENTCDTFGFVLIHLAAIGDNCRTFRRHV